MGGEVGFRPKVATFTIFLLARLVLFAGSSIRLILGYHLHLTWLFPPDYSLDPEEVPFGLEVLAVLLVSRQVLSN